MSVYRKKTPRITATKIESSWWTTPALAPLGFAVDTGNQQVTVLKEGRTFVGVEGDYCVEDEAENEPLSIMAPHQIAADWDLISESAAAPQASPADNPPDHTGLDEGTVWIRNKDLQTFKWKPNIWGGDGLWLSEANGSMSWNRQGIMAGLGQPLFQHTSDVNQCLPFDAWCIHFSVNAKNQIFNATERLRIPLSIQSSDAISLAWDGERNRHYEPNYLIVHARPSDGELQTIGARWEPPTIGLGLAEDPHCLLIYKEAVWPDKPATWPS